MNVCYSISKGDMSGKVKGMADIAPVSYTHLTLPTIYSV